MKMLMIRRADFSVSRNGMFCCYFMPTSVA